MSLIDFQRGPARLRWLLIAIVLLAIMPVFVLYMGRLHSSSTEALADARELAATLARNGAGAQDQLIGNSRSLLEAVIHIPDVRNATAHCSGTLEGINLQAPWASSIFLVNREGIATCSSRPNAVGVNFSDRQYFKDAAASGRFVVSEAIIGRITKHPVVAAALPIMESDGSIAGVLILGVELTWIPSISAVARAKHDGVVLAISRDGGLISRHHRDATTVNVTQTVEATGASIRRLMDASTPNLEINDGGVERIFGIAHTKDAQLTVAVGFDQSAVLEPITQRFWTDLLWLLLVAAGSVAIALTVAEFSVLRGVRMLNTAALRLKAGRMGVRVKLSPRVATELHDLAASFNSMIAEFERLAYLDRLTGLPNRRYLERQMVLRSVPDDDGMPVREALLAIDLDGFKPVNDAHGHAMGDRVLTAIARRIAGVADGQAILARLGGDEFVALLPLNGAADGRDHARRFGEEIRAALAAPIDIDGTQFPVGASIGIALVPDDAETLSGALVAADAALYEAKRAGRNRVIDHASPLAADMDMEHEPGMLDGYWASLGRDERY